MQRRARRPILLGVTALVLLGLGTGTAVALDDALGIRSEPSEVPTESVTPIGASPYVAPPRFTTVSVDAESTQIAAAVDELGAAVDDASVVDGEATLTVSVGQGALDDAYELREVPGGFEVVSASEQGAARGVYDMAATIRDGRSVTELIGGVRTSALPFRMVDLGAVGVTPDEGEWLPGTNYSHNSGAFADVLLADAPYIDDAAIAEARDDFDTYARHVAAEGYTAIAFPGLIEYLTFGDENDDRAAAMREAFAPFWRDADALGLDVFLRTDMLTLTPALDAMLQERFGRDTTDPQLWAVYTDALDALYAEVPELDGVLIRIGEAGNVYDLEGLPYYSELAVTDVASVRAMLTAFSEAAEAADREVIFRSWSVGVGAVGDMHTDPESYEAVLAGLDSPALIVSTKYTLGDFYSHLPFNDTLEVGDQRRIIEFQSRREFEAFGAFPNDLGSQYADAIRRFTDANPNVEGIWTWTQDGGPWRAGPMSLELEAGFWQLYELNTELAVRLARDPSLDPAAITTDWARRWFSDDPATASAIAEAMSQSRTAITEGLYIGPFADRRVFAIGLEPPPMMWIFEWDIVTGDSAVLSVIYDVSRKELEDAIGGGQRALDAVDEMGAAIEATDPAAWRDPAMRDEFITTLNYERSTLEVLGAYREMFLRQMQWHDTGAGHELWVDARDRYQAAAEQHLLAWEGDVQHPPLNLVAADLGVARAERDLGMAWSARVLLVLVVGWLVFGIVARRRPVGRVAWAHLVAAALPWRAASVVEPLSRGERVLLLAVPAVALGASRGILTWFEAPAHALTMLAAWLIFALTLCWLSSARSARVETGLTVLAALGGAALFRIVLLLAVLLPTGPGGYWFHFWTDPTGRAVYVTLAFALFVWAIIAPAWAYAAVAGTRRAIGIALAAVGAVLALIGGFVALVGLEQALTVWNDQLGLLPWGLSRILGITVYLEIPPESAVVAAVAGVVLFAAGLGLRSARAKRDRVSKPA